MKNQNENATLPPAQILHLARRCGIKATEAALVEFAALVREAQPLSPEEMRPAPAAQPVEPAVPAVGGALVAMPRIPTEAMLNAARDWSVKKYRQGIGNDAAVGCWQAMYDAAKPIPVMQTLTALIETLRPIVQAVGVNDRDTLGSLIGDDSVVFEGAGSWEGSRFVTMGDLRRITDFVRSQQAGATQPIYAAPTESAAAPTDLTDVQILSAFWEQTGRDWIVDETEFAKRDQRFGYFFNYGQLIDAVRSLLATHQPATQAEGKHA